MTAKPKVLIANWKMNLGVTDSLDLAKEIKSLIPASGKTKVRISASSLVLPELAKLLRGTRIEVGAQNVHWAESGAFTGELSVNQLREVGATFALVGHSERRNIMNESSDLCAKRASGALLQNFNIVFCIGETLTERQSNQTEQVLVSQLTPLLQTIKLDCLGRLVFAYEPVWAIGTGKAASVMEIEHAHSTIAKVVSNHFKQANPLIVYGGSITPDNFSEIAGSTFVDGGLPGGASLNASKLLAILNILEKSTE